MKTYLKQKRWSSRGVPVLAAVHAVSLVLSGCGSDFREGAPVAQQVTSITTSFVPPHWIGNELAVPPPDLREVGKAQFAPLDTPLTMNPKVDPDVGEIIPSSGRLSAMGPDGTIYDVLIAPEDIQRVGREWARRHGTGGIGGAGEQPRPSEERASGYGLPFNVDNRQRWDDPGYRGSSRDRIVMNNTSGGQYGTGAMIWKNLVLTAMHTFFVYNGTGNWVSGLQYQPGRDRTTLPFGSLNHVWKYWDTTFTANNCHITYTASCKQWDWAVVVLEQTPVETSTGTPITCFGYWTEGDSTIVSEGKVRAGFPKCGIADAPSSCANQAMYSDTHFTSSTAAFFNNINGWNRNFSSGSSISGGDSGSPVFAWKPAVNVDVVLAITLWERCQQSGCSTVAYPADHLRIDESLANSIAYFRSLYP